MTTEEKKNLTQKEMRGSLFKNTNKVESRQPDYHGNCLINGEHFWMAGWIESYGNNQKRLAVQFTPMESAEL